MRKDIYCEISFLLLCLSKLEDAHANFESQVDYELWSAISKTILSSHVKLHLDLDKEEYGNEIGLVEKERLKAARKDRAYEMSFRERVLWDINLRQQNQELHLVLSEPNPLAHDFHFELEKHYNGIYFTCADRETCQKVMDAYGIFVLCPDNIMDFKHVLTDQGVALHKGCQNDWNLIFRHKILPCNAMIIVDNYILNDTNLMVENLTQIIDAIKPQLLKIKIPFHISIFTTLRNDKGKDLPVDCRWDELIKIAKDVNVIFTIIKCQEDFHDRTIITNNQFIGCGYGFILFNKKISKKTTTVSIVCPFLNYSTKWALEGYSNVIKDVRVPYYKNLSTYGGNITYSFPQFVVGNKVNRILDIIQ